MKKQITLLSILALTGGIAFGQIALNNDLPTERMAINKTQSKGGIKIDIASQKAAGDTISYNDFSTPGDWTIANTGSPSADWAIGTAAPTGSYSAGMDTMNSTSGGNFALFDSDALGSGSSIQDATIQLTAPINLGAFTNVIIQFESYYRKYQGNCYVETSTDGTTWTQYEVHTDITTNTSTTNPELVRVNVSASIGGASTAYIRFRFTGAWDYAWMVDDVALVEPYANDLKIHQVLSFTGSQQLQYTQIPSAQLTSPIVTSFSAFAENGGLNSQDVILNVTQGGAYNGLGTLVTIPSQTTDSVYIAAVDGYTIPSTIGNYPFTYRLTSDNNTLDNTVDDTTSVGFQVTDNIMASDSYDGTLGSITGAFTGWQGGTGDAGIGAQFEFFQPASFQHVKVGIYPVAVADQPDYMNPLTVALYKYDGTDFQPFVVSQEVTITAADFGNLVDLPFTAPVNVVAGDVLLAIAGFTAGADVPIALAGFVPAGQTIGVNAGTLTGLASDDGVKVEAPVVRINFSNAVTIAPNADQTIMQDVNGAQLAVLNEGPATATSREWKFSTTSGSGYASFATAQTGISYTPNFPNVGVYYVVCESTFPGPEVATSNEVKINVILNTGIEENTAPNFAVYSVENGLNIDLSSTELKGATIQVVSMDGKVIAKQALTTNQMNTIKVNVPTGIYFYAISNDSSSYQGKVFIK